MNQDQPEPTFDESVAQVMQTLPPVIRAYLTQGKYTTVAKGLMTTYGLRIDQAGVLEREIMLLLMGIDNPDEFTQALVEEAKLDQKVIAGIVQDINTQIFIPLREEEMKSGGMKTEPTVPQPPRPAVAPSAGGPRPLKASLPAGVVGPPLQSPTYFHLENKIAPPLRPMKPSVLQPAQPAHPVRPLSSAPTRLGERSALRDVLATITRPSPKATEGAAKLLEDHEEPHIDIRDKVQVTSSPVIQPTVSAPLKPSTLPVAPIAPAKPYSGDPYREPI